MKDYYMLFLSDGSFVNELSRMNKNKVIFKKGKVLFLNYE